MQFVARTRASPAEIESFAEPRYGAFSSAVVSLALAHDFIELCSQQGANRQAFCGRQFAGFPQDVGVDVQSDFRFHSWREFTRPRYFASGACALASSQRALGWRKAVAACRIAPLTLGVASRGLGSLTERESGI